MYSNRNGGFRDSGYAITDDMSSWQLVIVTGEGDSSSSSTGTSKFYTAAEGSSSVTYRGSADRVASGTAFYRIGWPGQGPGKVAAAYQWDRVLTKQDMDTLLASGPSGAPPTFRRPRVLLQLLVWNRSAQNTPPSPSAPWRRRASPLTVCDFVRLPALQVALSRCLVSSLARGKKHGGHGGCHQCAG